MITENNEIPPYQRLARSVIDGREYSVTDGTECLRLYSVLLEKSDLNCPTASLSLLECQRVSVPTVRVAVNSKIKILYRFGISQDPHKRSMVQVDILRRNRSIAKETRLLSLGLAPGVGTPPLSCLLPLIEILFCQTERLRQTPRITWENEPRRQGENSL
jgi:hypothetical protein